LGKYVTKDIPFHPIKHYRRLYKTMPLTKANLMHFKTKYILRSKIIIIALQQTLFISSTNIL